ncbi:hypothetical protein DERF_007036 [Dermatophagoides farinae]|uniref:Uncharacterized protein n=1 Tax=Dermatophagoides farinae TaxID=6954 RepID=A0A922L2P1_DERFA|nr:hypothetical protein DERF_007036 [Dermatophagoides farinae]
MKHRMLTIIVVYTHISMRVYLVGIDKDILPINDNDHFNPFCRQHDLFFMIKAIENFNYIYLFDTNSDDFNKDLNNYII